MSSENEATQYFFKPAKPVPVKLEQATSSPSIVLPPQYLDAAEKEDNKGRPDMITCYRNLYPTK